MFFKIHRIEVDKIIYSFSFHKNNFRDFEIVKIENSSKFPDLRITEAIENINKRLNNNNIRNQPTEGIDNVINRLENLSLKTKGKETITRKISTNFYKYE